MLWRQTKKMKPGQAERIISCKSGLTAAVADGISVLFTMSLQPKGSISLFPHDCRALTAPAYGGIWFQEVCGFFLFQHVPLLNDPGRHR